MVKNGDVDGEVAGANNATGDVLRPAFQYVKTLPGISVVSGAFIMLIPDTMFGEHGMMVFADCAVHPNPTAEELAQIAVMTGRTARVIAGHRTAHRDAELLDERLGQKMKWSTRWFPRRCWPSRWILR